MASGGDLGASVAPQLMGIVTDAVSASSLGVRLSEQFSLSPEQIGLKAGMLACAIFPILGIVMLFVTIRFFKRIKKQA